ncbi:Sugar phosphate permease [Rhizobiales bacterium GAS188]|nr:Sugar phosphate permease [Rhizobiales bacterium GAS188]
MNDEAQSASRKAFWRLMPFLILCYFFAYLDRQNMSFAALGMNKDLGYNSEIFGFGAGIFFIGYFLFEVPSNLILAKVGARVWIARIMITWGVISLCMIFQDASWNAIMVPIAAPIAAFYRGVLWLIGTPSNFVDLTPNAAMLIVLRFLLGLAEAGFFPGIILFLTYWFTAKDRAKMVGIFMAAIPLSSVIGSPVSSWILIHVDGLMGLAGWKWLFIIEAVPTVLLGVVVFFYLTDKPEDAHWLEPEERQALAASLAAERSNREAMRHFSLGQALANPRVLALSAVYFGNVTCNYGLGFFMPQILQRFGLSVSEVGWLVPIPYIAGAIAMVLWGRHSDDTGERVWHVAAPLILAGVSFVAAAYANSLVLALIALSFAAIGIFSSLPTFWTLPTGFLTGAAAAGGIALINSLGNLGGFVGPSIFGHIKQVTGQDSFALLTLALFPIIAGVITVVLGHDKRLEMAGEPAIVR